MEGISIKQIWVALAPFLSKSDTLNQINFECGNLVTKLGAPTPHERNMGCQTGCLRADFLENNRLHKGCG
jgi:hypothetical protein